MKLLCLSVENFGVLHEFHIDLTDGLNVFCRENGAGKTTLAAFLCAMLYGLPVSRKNDIAENDRKKYRPWQGGVFGGSITSVHLPLRAFFNVLSVLSFTVVSLSRSPPTRSHIVGESIEGSLYICP